MVADGWSANRKLSEPQVGNRLNWRNIASYIAISFIERVVSGIIIAVLPSGLPRPRGSLKNSLAPCRGIRMIHLVTKCFGERPAFLVALFAERHCCCVCIQLTAVFGQGRIGNLFAVAGALQYRNERNTRTHRKTHRTMNGTPTRKVWIGFAPQKRDRKVLSSTVPVRPQVNRPSFLA